MVWMTPATGIAICRFSLPREEPLSGIPTLVLEEWNVLGGSINMVWCIATILPLGQETGVGNLTGLPAVDDRVIVASEKA